MLPAGFVPQCGSLKADYESGFTLWSLAANRKLTLLPQCWLYCFDDEILLFDLGDAQARSDWAAVSTAVRAALSQESVLVPTR
jgi:hypothetical protein